MTSTQTLGAEPRSPTLEDVIRAGLRSLQREVNVALPGRVEAYDSSKQLAEVQPLVQELVATREGTERVETLPVIPNVPVIFPRAGGYFLTLPVAVGDYVQLLVNQRSVDAWFNGDGRIKNPNDFRMHDLSDAVALPGFYPLQDALEESGVGSHLVLGRVGGAQVHVKQQEIHAGSENASDFVALADLVRAEVQKAVDYATAIKAVFNIVAVGVMDGGLVNAQSKQTAAQNIAAPTIDAPAASVLKAD